MTEQEKIEQIKNLLGGYNCGGCGYSTCEECAKEIVSGNISADSCLPIDSDNIDVIKELLNK